ncbi:MAG: hypothetical protein DRI56_13035 [Chloroflexota bacterium]|nr:MAG: hypothetical protein DRI56_13035 [Chloroflexota bacterium]
MNGLRISATDLKKNVSQVLSEVYFHKKPTIVERYGKAIVKIVPITSKAKEKAPLKEVLNAYYGALPSFPPAAKARKFRKRSLSL